MSWAKGSYEGGYQVLDRLLNTDVHFTICCEDPAKPVSIFSGHTVAPKARTRPRSPGPLRKAQIITRHVALLVTSGQEAPNVPVGTVFVTDPLVEVAHLPYYQYPQSPQHPPEVCLPDAASEVGEAVAGQSHVSCRLQFGIRPYIASQLELLRFALPFLESEVNWCQLHYYKRYSGHRTQMRR